VSIDAAVIAGTQRDLESCLDLLLQDSEFEEKRLTDGIEMAGRRTLLTPKDLTLILDSVKWFMQLCEEIPWLKMLRDQVGGPEKPQSSDTDGYTLFGPPGTPPMKELDAGRLSVLVDAMNMIDCERLSSEETAGLFKDVRILFHRFMELKEEMGLAGPPVTHNDSEPALRVIEEHHTAITADCDRLAAADCQVACEIERYKRQFHLLQAMHIESHVVPCPIELYPNGFLKSFASADSPTDVQGIYRRLLVNVWSVWSRTAPSGSSRVTSRTPPTSRSTRAPPGAVPSPGAVPPSRRRVSGWRTGARPSL